MLKNKIAQILLMIVALLGGGYTINDNLRGGQEARFNKIDNLTTIATTTTSVQAVKLLSLDADRRYAVVSNISDTAIYLYATTTDLSAVDPSSSITSLDGIYLAATSNFVFDTNNMVYSNIWASSTAASKNINVSYK